MKLTAKKNGKGYETSYAITFVSAEIIDDGILIKFKKN